MKITKEKLLEIIGQELDNVQQAPEEPEVQEKDPLAMLDTYFEKIKDENLYYKLLMKTLNHVPAGDPEKRKRAFVKLFGSTAAGSILKALGEKEMTK